MVLYADGIIPTRFLTLISHLTIIIIILSSRDENVKACLPLEYTKDEYRSKDLQLTIGLILALTLLIIELIGFLTGVSMFMPFAAIISIGSHFIASIALSYFILDEWDCNIYWWMFAFCSVLPALVEVTIAFGVVALKKT